MKSISKYLSNCQEKDTKAPTGLNFTLNYGVYLFLKHQVQNWQVRLRGKDLCNVVELVLESRPALAQRVVDRGGWGKQVRERIMNPEVL